MAGTRGFPDLELALLDHLADLVGGDEHTGNETPDDLQGRLPFLRVTRIGGSDDGLTDSAEVDVEVVAPTRRVAWTLAELVRERLTARPFRVGTVVIDRATTTVSPFQPPAVTAGVRLVRYAASYTVRVRRTAM